MVNTTILYLNEGDAMASFSNAERSTIIQGLDRLRYLFSCQVMNPLRSESIYVADELSDFSELIDVLQKYLQGLAADLDNAELPENYYPICKEAVIIGRKHIAESIERRGQNIHNSDIKEKLQKEIEPYDSLINSEWFRTTDSVIVPRLLTYMSLRCVEKYMSQYIVNTSISERNYDEKFHILQSPNLFENDLNIFRIQCDLRGSSVAVAFIDIDDFKSFNSKYGNERIDRDVLPRFMEIMESHVYGRGYGYRQGGDEYLVLLPSVSYKEAIAILNDLREKLSQLVYPGISEKTTVSIGLCFVDYGCFLTDKEVREKANKASAFAKKSEPGKPVKNCIATYKEDGQFKDEDLYVAAPSL